MKPVLTLLSMLAVVAFGASQAIAQSVPEPEFVAVELRLPPMLGGASDMAPSRPDSQIPLVIDRGFPGSNPAFRPMDSFEISDVDQRIKRQLQNTFTFDPSFDSGLSIFGQNAAMKIGGYVKADLIADLDAIDSTDTFDTVSIPTGGPSRRNVRFHARQTRLSFDTRWKVSDHIVRAFVETDFFGNLAGDNGQLRLRHAYGSLGRFTAGQTWTTFTDPSAVPQTLDFEGAVSNVNRRQALVRWDQPLPTGGLTWALAVEDPQIIVVAPPLVTGEGRTQSPDFLSRLRLEREFGDLQGALLLRELGYQPVGQSVISEIAWGFNFTGSLFLRETTKGYFQVTFGEGIGSYRGVPDVVATGPITASILPVFGWMVGIHHEWCDGLTSNVTYSQLSLENLTGEALGNLSDTDYFAVNLIANPYDRVFCGIEYLYGKREDVSGETGTAHRIQLSFGFFLP